MDNAWSKKTPESIEADFQAQLAFIKAGGPPPLGAYCCLPVPSPDTIFLKLYPSGWEGTFIGPSAQKYLYSEKRKRLNEIANCVMSHGARSYLIEGNLRIELEY